ncbi:hypothetical protein CPC08DRAFT_710206 [Agrocybe pediades]|nr:hypothetical protein CPC08DRAFT_710206 [Agrocybe pediades]
MSSVAEERDNQIDEKEQEAWQAIREAHYEAIEQLPLTLQRQLSLMRQLDEQTISCTSSLIPALKKYIHQRRAMADISEDVVNGVVVSNPPGTANPTSPEDVHREDRSTTSSLPSESAPRNSSSPEKNCKQSEVARELLSHVAWMSDELLRASQEKVNLAQANHDMVERHIRLLDQAIKEQEAALSANTSVSSNALVSQLPELVVPKYTHKSRNGTRSAHEMDILSNVVDVSVGATSKPTILSRLSGTPQDMQKETTSLTITLPATQPTEELYCYCNRVSFGEMIACDGESCEREWFHLGCVGLTEVPEGEWYCEDCRIEEL